MNKQQVFERYQKLQRYVGWTDEDAQLIQSLAPLVDPHFSGLVEDFYAAIERHPEAAQVITGGQTQIDRLKGTLVIWLRELFSGKYDADYVYRRWKIGYRHVEIGLDQVYTNVALSRLRSGLMRVLERTWTASTEKHLKARATLNVLLDLDLALIEDAYQTEFAFRQQATERLALIGQVAGGIAHELRNPLNVIKTSAFFLLNARHAAPEKISQHLERIERQVGLADDVIASLTNFAKMAPADQQPFDVLSQIEEVLKITLSPENVRIVINCPRNVPLAIADASQIRIVLGNLIRNAIEAMPDGGTLQLSVDYADPYLDIAVQDSGKGIEPDSLPRIMEPFFSTKARGIGLGLPLAKAIAEKNEGRILVKSDCGQGSTFTIRLRARPAIP